MRGGGREWVVVDRAPTSNESFETLETFVPPGPPGPSPSLSLAFPVAGVGRYTTCDSLPTFATQSTRGVNFGEGHQRHAQGPPFPHIHFSSLNALHRAHPAPPSGRGGLRKACCTRPCPALRAPDLRRGQLSPGKMETCPIWQVFRSTSRR